MSLVLLAAVSLVPALTSSGPGVPPIRVWLSTPRSDIYVHTGDPVRVLFRSGEDGYVLIIRASSTGRVQMLFPGDPADTAPVPGGGTYEVLGGGQPESFVIDEAEGSGYVLAAWSSHPFDLAQFARKDAAGGWDYSAINAVAERVSSDAPRSILERIARTIADQTSFEYDVTAYTVADQPVVVAETPPPYEDERQPPQQYQMPEPASTGPGPAGYPYPYLVEYYQPVPFHGRDHRHHRAFVPCEWQCYPGSPNTLSVGSLRRGSTGSGLIIGQGDPARYLAVPQKPKPQVVTRVAPAARAAAVASPALVVANSQRRADEKITFGPVAPIRSRVRVTEPAPVRGIAAAQIPAPVRAVTAAAVAAVPSATAARVYPNRIPAGSQPQGYATIAQPAGAVAYTATRPSPVRPAGAVANAGAAATSGSSSRSSGGSGARAYVGPPRPVVVRGR